MNYTIERLEDGFQLTIEGESPQWFADIVLLEDELVRRLHAVWEAEHQSERNVKWTEPF